MKTEKKKCRECGFRSRYLLENGLCLACDFQRVREAAARKENDEPNEQTNERTEP